MSFFLYHCPTNHLVTKIGQYHNHQPILVYEIRQNYLWLAVRHAPNQKSIYCLLQAYLFYHFPTIPQTDNDDPVTYGTQKQLLILINNYSRYSKDFQFSKIIKNILSHFIQQLTFRDDSSESIRNSMQFSVVLERTHCFETRELDSLSVRFEVSLFHLLTRLSRVRLQKFVSLSQNYNSFFFFQNFL